MKTRRSIEDVFRLRKKNLRALAQGFSSVRQMALELGLTEAFLKQIIGDNSVRVIDDALARKIEQRLNVPAQCLDSDSLFK